MVVLELGVLQLENAFRSVLIFAGLLCQVFMPDVGKLASDKNATVFFFDSRLAGVRNRSDCGKNAVLVLRDFNS